MYYIGIDLGGTNIAAGLVNELGKIVDYQTIATNKARGVEAIVQDMVELCNTMIRKSNLKKEEIHSIGIGVPGFVDSEKGLVVYATNLDIKDFPMGPVIEKKLEIPVYLGNDADCAALGEITSGIAKGCLNAIVITLGTGVGGGIIINGKIFSGSFPGGGELGHEVIVQNGRQCPCGRKGCLEAYASATALTQDAKAAALAYPDSLLSQLTLGDITQMDAKIPFDAAAQGDEIGQQVINEYIGYLATGITNLINIFKPEMIVLGGGVAKQKENLTKPLTEMVKKEVYAGDLRTKIKVALLGNDAGIIGAAMLGK